MAAFPVLNARTGQSENGPNFSQIYLLRALFRWPIMAEEKINGILTI